MTKATVGNNKEKTGLSSSFSDVLTLIYRRFRVLLFWRNGRRFTVSMKLNVVNILVIISGFLSIVGAYEIQMGGEMHGLNYSHQKYITELVKTVETFEQRVEESDLSLVEEYVGLIKQQPIDCLDLIGPFESYMMSLIETDGAITVCENDLEIADNLLTYINDYRTGNIDKPELLAYLRVGIAGFEKSGVQFEPLVNKTVEVTFFTVITIVVAKAFIVPVFGLLLSRSVALDYRTLSKTKLSLEREKKQNMLIQSERMASLNTLVAGIAHEVNTPLGVSITANSHASQIVTKIQNKYRSGCLTENDFCNFFKEIEEVNNIISSNLLRTSDLISSFKMISVDQIVDKKQVVSLKKYIEQVLVSLSPLTKNTAIDIKFQCEQDLKGAIYVAALAQIITNMVTNVIGHAFQCEEQGEFIIVAKKNAVDELHLSFKDNGCGICEVDLIHIFEPFFTTKSGGGGTGLGLHVLHNLVVDKLQGRINCTSKLGVGTQFDVYIPFNFR